MSAAQHLLDQLQSVGRIADLAAAPETYAGHLAAEVGDATTLAALEARDDLLRRALGQLDGAIERVMRIRLDAGLAADTSLPAPTRRLFASTVLRYQDTLDVLEDRARDAAARGGAADPAAVAATVGDAARAALALREAVRAPVLTLIGDLARAAVALADRSARDRQLDEPQRLRWSAARRDLEILAAEPDRIEVAAMAARLAAWPAQLDEPAPAKELTFAELIEMD
jgi:hypothetical protein